MKLSVIIPAYNEEEILPSTLRTVAASMEDMHRRGVFHDYEIIFVSDGSRDQTAAILRDAMAHPRPEIGGTHLKTCIYEPNRGKGCAVRTGILASSGDIVVYTDCDLAYGMHVIEEAVLRITETNADVLIGSRAIHPEGYAGYTFLRKLASVLYLRILSLAAGFNHSDSQAGFKALRGDIGREIFSACQTDGFAFDLEMLMRAGKRGCTFTEMPIKIVNHRQSSIHLVRDSMRMLRDLRTIKKRLKDDESTQNRT